MTLRWSEQAADDLIAIHDFIAEDNPNAAAATIERLFQSVERLPVYPRLGRAGFEEGTRELVIASWILVYRVIGDVVNIEAVIHASRKIR